MKRAQLARLILVCAGLLAGCLPRGADPDAGPDADSPRDGSDGSDAGSEDQGPGDGLQAGDGDVDPEPPADAGEPDAGAPPRLVEAYTGSLATRGFAADARQNMGHQFQVTSDGIVLYELGVFDQDANGLGEAHEVALFAIDRTGLGATATPIEGAKVTVPAGVEATLSGGVRYAPLSEPIPLAPGTYAVVAYGMNAVDSYGDGGNVPYAGTGVVDADFDVYEFTADGAGSYPTQGDQNDHACASFRYASPRSEFLRIMPLGASITEGVGSTGGGYRQRLGKLLDEQGIAHQFVGGMTNNVGSLAPDQRHHEGHSGWVIEAGTSGRAGVLDQIDTWLGPTGNAPDLVLILLGTNDCDLDYMLADAANRMDKLVTRILDANTGLRPGARVLLAQLPAIQNEAKDARVRIYNEGLAGVVARHRDKGERIGLVDMHSPLGAGDFNDALHPNDGGYEKVARTWLDAIKAE